jgi:hypothetical protein
MKMYPVLNQAPHYEDMEELRYSSIAPYILNLSTLDGGGWSALHPVHFTSSPQRAPTTHWIKISQVGDTHFKKYILF